MTQRAWRVYLIGLTTLILGYWLIPVPMLWWGVAWQLLIAYSAVGAMVMAARRMPRGDRLPWYLIALGVAGNSTGVLVNHYLNDVLHHYAQPNIADAFYLSLYPGTVAGIALMIRRWRPRMLWPAMIDSATVTAGLSILGWVYAIDPALHDPNFDWRGHLVRVAYPIGDIVMFAMTLLLVRSAGSSETRRDGWHAAPPWIATGLLTFLCGDLIWLVLGNLGENPSPFWARAIDAVFCFAFLIFGYAVRHAATTAEIQAGGRPHRPGVSLMLTLLAALLMAPTVLVVELTNGDALSGWAIAAGSAIMSVLVVTRLTQLLRQSERQADQVRELSRRDELTGLPNRRAWQDELPRVLEQARRTGKPVSIGMIDLDHFKAFNDSHGHPAGDRLLKEAAAAWHGGLRSSDILARYGGEEFILLLPGADSDQAIMVLDRVRKMTPSGQTYSSGVATWDGTETSEELIARADAALYSAKHSGRDRVVAAV